MLNSSPHHTANMKLLLFKLVVCCAAVLAAPADKQKRDILPGDPRYGTEHHPHHENEHLENENEVQISKAAGGYVGSYTVPDDTQDHSFQVQPQQIYGPPNHTPGKPLGTDFLASGDTDKTPASVHLLVPSTSYGIPDTQLFNLESIDDKKPAIIKDEVIDSVPLQKTIPDVHHDVHPVEQPAVVQKHHVGNFPQTVSLPQVKVTASHVPTQGVIQHSVPSFNSFSGYSYPSFSNIPVKTLDHTVQVQVPHPYQVPVTKHIAVPVPVPHTVQVPKPYYIRVPQPVQVTVDRPYPVEVPRPVPYPVPQYVKTNFPVAADQHHVTLDTKANPLQTFFDNTQFQNVLAGIPTFSSPLEGFQNPFENFDLSSFNPISFIPSSISSSIPFLPQPAAPSAPAGVNLLSSGTNGDSITIDNPTLKDGNIVTKPAVVHPVVPQVVPHIVPQVAPQVVPLVAKPHTTHTGSTVYKPSTACAGCTVPSVKSNVQPTGGYGVYSGYGDDSGNGDNKGLFP